MVIEMENVQFMYPGSLNEPYRYNVHSRMHKPEHERQWEPLDATNVWIIFNIQREERAG